MEKTTSLGKIQSFVGDIDAHQLAFVESFLSEKMALFMPVGGYCGYSVTKNHTHPCSMFTIHFDDLGEIEFGGEIYQSQPDTTFFLSPGVPHHELTTNRPARFLALFLSEKLLEEVYRKYEQQKKLPIAAIFPTPEGLLESLKAFMQESRSTFPQKEEILEGIVLRVVHILVRMLLGVDERQDHPQQITENFRINRVVEYIYRNLDQKITLEGLAAHAHFSVSHFSQLFRRETGESPHRYLLLTRLHHARRLLKEGKLNLTEIALECGFSGSSHLSSAFRKEFGVSPSGYRKKRKI